MANANADSEPVEGVWVHPSRKTHKKCIKCREWKPIVDMFNESGALIASHAFGIHDSSEDGLQTICYACKHQINTHTRNRNVRQRLRHHTTTRCLTQLGNYAPETFSANVETFLGYTMSSLVKHLSAELKSREGPKRKLVDALSEGYHIDHIYPLSRFQVLVPAGPDPDGDKVVDWSEFRRCWQLSNLRAIPSEENLKKGARVHTREHVRADTVDVGNMNE